MSNSCFFRCCMLCTMKKVNGIGDLYLSWLIDEWFGSFVIHDTILCVYIKSFVIRLLVYCTCAVCGWFRTSFLTQKRRKRQSCEATDIHIRIYVNFIRLNYLVAKLGHGVNSFLISFPSSPLLYSTKAFHKISVAFMHVYTYKVCSFLFLLLFSLLLFLLGELWFLFAFCQVFWGEFLNWWLMNFYEDLG